MLVCRVLALACLSIAWMTAAHSQENQATGDARGLQANILIVESHGAIARWVRNPGGGDAGRARKITPGRKIYAPVVVTGLKTADFGQTGIWADLDFVAPDGRVLYSAKKCCSAVRGDPRTPGLVVLNPVLDYRPVSGDPLGTYELRATVTFGSETANASETFQVVDATRQVVKSARSGLRSAVAASTAQNKPSKAHLDARHCLDFQDNAAVIRCAEDYR